MATLFLGCGGVSSTPITDAGAGADTGGELPAEEQLAFRDDGAATQTFSVTIASLVTGSRGQLFNLQSLSSDGKSSLSINIARNPGPVTLGDYSCGPTVALVFSTFSPGASYSGTGEGGSCLITISALGTREGEGVAGRFSGTLVSGTGARRTLSEGRFALPVTVVAAP